MPHMTLSQEPEKLAVIHEKITDLKTRPCFTSQDR